MQTNIARAGDYDKACAAGNTRMTILIVDDDTTARLTLSAMISNEDEYRVFLGSDRPQTDQRPGATGDGLRCRQDAPAVSESDA
jgi:hypothetical protein